MSFRSRELKFEKIGTEYGGWVLPTQLLTPRMVCYCGGVGEDLSFDFSLTERFGCIVHAFDPTPRSIEYVRNFTPKDNFSFHPWGLWNEETELKFFAPRNPLHVSHSIKNLQNTTDYFVAKCKPISRIMKEFRHTSIDLIKIDIEGSEYEVIEDLVSHRIIPQIMCAEFDQPASVFRIRRAIRSLEALGLVLKAIDRWNFTFVKCA